MPLPAATLIAAVTALGYQGLSDRDIRLILAGILANLAGLTAQTALDGAVAQGYYKLSDRDLDEILANILNNI